MEIFYIIFATVCLRLFQSKKLNDCYDHYWGIATVEWRIMASSVLSFTNLTDLLLF